MMLLLSIFSKKLPPVLSSRDLNLGLGMSLSELYRIRINEGFKIIENFEYNSSRNPGYGVINSKKTFSGGYSYQLINNVFPGKSYRCDIIFIGFDESTVRKIMNDNFESIHENKWRIIDNQHFIINNIGYNNYELLCSNQEGTGYV